MPGTDWRRRLASTAAVLTQPAVFVAGVASALVGLGAIGGLVAGAGVLSVVGIESEWLLVAGAVAGYEVGVVLLAPLAVPGLVAALRASGVGPDGGGPDGGGPDRGGPGSTQGDTDDSDSAVPLRTVLGAVRTQYRQLAAGLVVARLAAYGFALLLAPVVVGAVLVAATGVSVLGYAVGVVQTPDPLTYLVAAVALIFAVRAVGLVPVAHTPLLVLDGVAPRRAWLASARLVRQRPGTAGTRAVAAVAVASLPILGGLVAAWALDIAGDLGLVGFVAAVLAAGTITGPTAMLVRLRVFDGAGRHGANRHGTDRLGADGRERGDRDADWSWGVSADRRRTLGVTVLALVLFTGLVAGSAGLRISDVRPNAEASTVPVADSLSGSGTPDPGTIYQDAARRTVYTSRNVTITSVDVNWTTGERQPVVRTSFDVDVPDRELSLLGRLRREGSWDLMGSGYASDGLFVTARLTVRPDHSIAETRVDGARVYAAPYYATATRSFPVSGIEADALDWDAATVKNGSVVLTVTDPAAVQAAVGHLDPETTVYRNGSRIEARIDGQTGRLDRVDVTTRSVSYETPDRTTVESRSHTTQTIVYRYDGVSVRGPPDVGSRPRATLWDLLYY